jgi:hypothetical protein
MSGNTVQTGFEFKYSVVSLVDDSTAVSTKQSIIRGVFINTVLSAQALLIKDGTNTVFTIPASAAAGTFYNFGDAVFTSGIVIDPDNSATGNITVIYKTV